MGFDGSVTVWHFPGVTGQPVFLNELIIELDRLREMGSRTQDIIDGISGSAREFDLEFDTHLSVTRRPKSFQRNHPCRRDERAENQSRVWLGHLGNEASVPRENL